MMEHQQTSGPNKGADQSGKTTRKRLGMSDDEEMNISVSGSDESYGVNVAAAGAEDSDDVRDFMDSWQYFSSLMFFFLSNICTGL